LKDYVAREDDSFSYEIVNREVEDGMTVLTVNLTSQTWQGIAWRHWLTIIRPEEIRHEDKGLLFISGGNIDSPPTQTSGGEARALMMTAKATRTTTALLRQVPNQPLFDGLREDALISLSYERFLSGAGDDWPLLFPMVKSAVRAMDAIQAITEAEFGRPVEQFLVTGGSKRGWTTWLAAVVDERIERIAPMIIDMLNTRDQMRHQLNTYGGYTESIGDYTQRELQERLLAGEGDALVAQVDPYAWRDELALPKLIVLGANDPYWTVDAANFYFDGLQGRKYLYYQANTGHDVGMLGIATTIEFYRELLTGDPFPVIEWKLTEENTLEVTWDRANGQPMLWSATSSNRDFRDAQWTSVVLAGDTYAEAILKEPESGWTASYVEVRWTSGDGLPFGLTTNMVVLPDRFPEPGIRAYDTATE
jgi:PhoPQ-activated pathogenicity-related protein